MRESRGIRKCLSGMLLIVPILVFFFTCISSAAEWAKTYGGRGGDIANSIQQTTDGGYIVAGETYSFGAGGYDAWILKLDTNGDVQWQKTYGGSQHDYVHSIQQTSDDGYIVAGHYYTGGIPNSWLLKLDTSGNVVWQKTYVGSSPGGIFHSVQQTSDGGYIVVGGIDSDTCVLKLDGDGNVVWQKAYDGGSNWYFSASTIQQTSDGGYILAGVTSFGAGESNFWILKLDTNGNIQWQKTYAGGSYHNYAQSIQQTSDGGYIVAGYHSDIQLSNAWILKLNADGTVAWQKDAGGWGGPEIANSIQQTSDGGYIVAGSTETFGAGSKDAWVLKLDTNGNVVWQKTYGGIGDDTVSSIQQTSDGGYIVAGSWSLSNRWDAWVLKLDSNGDIPDCPIVGISNATVTSTGSTVGNTTVTGEDTSIFPQTINLTSLDANATEKNGCSYSPPTIVYDATNFSFTAIQDGSNPYYQGLHISNEGIIPLNWSVSDNATWLSLSPTSGTNSGTVEVSVDITGLTAGIYNATITITATGATNSPVSIPVTLYVNPSVLMTTLFSPNGSEVIPSGSTFTIRWGAPPGAAKFKLQYSKDNGKTWILIASNVTGTSYNWLIPTLLDNKKQCLVKVKAFNSSGVQIGKDVSNSVFTIEVVKLTSPDGGETLSRGTTHTITWKTYATKNTVASVKLLYTTNGGTTWTLIDTPSGNIGSYNWTVPVASSSSCKVKVVLKDAGGTALGKDASDGFFTIQ